jgi:RNA polymerase sigma factor (sigma-70 family)
VTEHPDSSELGAPPARSRPAEHPASPHDAVPRDREDFADFYRRSYPRLVTFLRYHGAGWADAAELAQHAMAAAFRSWPTIRTPKAWVRTVAARAFARRLAEVAEVPTAEVPEPVAALPTVPPAEEWEQQHEILRLVASLPPRQRQVMAWTLDDYTPAEIADILDMAPEAVRQNLRRARTTLARRLNRTRQLDRTRQDPHGIGQEASHDA